MPMYMDVHYRVEGLTAKDIAESHRLDLAMADRHGVRWLNYWFDESTGKVFCLCEAPSAEAEENCHRQAHGLIADEIIEVSEYGDDADAAHGPLCMDMHFRVEGLKPEEIVEAIKFHVEAGAKHGVQWLKAWYDARSGRLFCLSQSPTTAAHVAVHGEAGLIVDEITQVTEGVPRGGDHPEPSRPSSQGPR